MTEVLMVVGALLGFCVLTFGAALVMAAWLGGSPRGPRGRGRGQR